MKKRLLSVVCGMGMLGLVGAGSVSNVYAANQLHLTVPELENIYSGWLYSHGYDQYSQTEYADVNQDGVYELIFGNFGELAIVTYDPYNYSYTTILDVNTGKAPSNLTYSLPKQEAIIMSASTGGCSYEKYYMEGNWAYLTDTYERTNGKFEPESWKHNGQYITYEEYIQFENSLTSYYHAFIE